MGISDSKLQPHKLILFKKLPTNVPLDNIAIPERPENRRTTNVKWLISLGVLIVLLLPFLIYTLIYSDLKRLTLGYDKCGNICGQLNHQWRGISCSGSNWTHYPYLQYDQEFHAGDIKVQEVDILERHCVQSCRSGYFVIMGRCVKGKRLDSGNGTTPSPRDVSKIKFGEPSIDVALYLDSVKWQIVISCLLSFVVAIGMLFLFRYAVAFVVWGILIGCFLCVVLLIAAFWYLYLTDPSVLTATQESKTGLLGFGLICTILAICVGIILIWCRKKIKLVILLLKEATKAIIDMPGLTIVPIVSVITIFILTILFALSTVAMSTAATLQQAMGDFYYYKPNPIMSFTMIYNFVVCLWLTQFFTGIQYMIIAGAVSKWYFSRDKTFLGRPIMTSVFNTMHFHLGSVALGATIITIIQLIKMIILGLISNKRIKKVVKNCIEPIESFFKFLSKNAYIITAMHGQAFLKSGKRAAKLIIQNNKDIMAINYIDEFILGMSKFLIVVITVLLSMGVFAIAPGSVGGSNILAYILIAFAASVVACVTFGVFGTAIDTLFICYCEDNLLNDGMARPYFMSRNLMQFVQDLKRFT